MTALGYVVALILAAALALGASYLVDRKYPVGRSFYLFILTFVGLFAGARLFGAFGESHYLSFTGPQVGGFYLLTGLLGGLPAWSSADPTAGLATAGSLAFLLGVGAMSLNTVGNTLIPVVLFEGKDPARASNLGNAIPGAMPRASIGVAATSNSVYGYGPNRRL